MLTLKEWMELVDYKITEGSDYWPEGNFGGKQLYSLSSWNGYQNGWSFSIVFDPKDNQRVYVVEACDYKHNRAYRLVDGSLKTSNEAWDDVNYIDLEEEDDFIQKALAIKAGEDYDTRVSIPLELPDDVMFELMKQAHEQDITMNQLVENVLWTAIRDHESKKVDELSDDEFWDQLAEDGLRDLEDDEMMSDMIELKPAAAMKAKKKKKSK